MYLLVNKMIKLSMLYGAEGLAPSLKFIDDPGGSPPVKNHRTRKWLHTS